MISKEVHSPPRLTIINTIIPKQEKKKKEREKPKLLPHKELTADRPVKQHKTEM